MSSDTVGPQFLQLPGGPAPLVPRIFFVLLLGIGLTAAVLSLKFEPPDSGTLRVHLFAPMGTDCRDWLEILAPASPRHRMELEVQPCVIENPEPQLSQFIRPGEVAAVLDPNLPFPGVSGEHRIAKDRYFFIKINPRTFNSYTWRHEVGGHVRAGHTAVTVPTYLARPVNTLLDLAFVDPYLAFGDNWRRYMAALLLLAVYAAWRWLSYVQGHTRK